MEKDMEETSDAVLCQNLYTNILSRQMNTENRLHRLMMSRQGLDETFDGHLGNVRSKIERDRARAQKLGELLVLLERKERKVGAGSHVSATKERILNGFSTLLKMNGLRDQFIDRGQNTSQSELFQQNNNNTNDISQRLSEPVQPARKFTNPFLFENPVSPAISITNASHTPHSPPWNVLDKQGHGGNCAENPRNSLRPESGAGSQCSKESLPKRVSFNDIPHFISNQGAGTSSDYREDQAEQSSQARLHKHSPTEQYREPPPEFGIYGYRDRNKQTLSETPPRTTEKQERTHADSSNRKERYNIDDDEEFSDISSGEGNNPFKSPWEEVASTSLQREKNDSTQAVTSSGTNQGASTTHRDETKKPISNTTTTTLNHFETEKKEHNKFEKWLNFHEQDDTTNQDRSEDLINKLYEQTLKTRHATNFIKDDALSAMRRKSWAQHQVSNTIETIDKKPKRKGRLGFIFHKPNTKTTRVKADKKDFPVNKKTRRRMSLRPLPQNPAKNEHALQFTTADSLDTFQAI